MSQGLKPDSQRDFLTWIFVSPDEPRLRAGWRLLIQTILYFILAIGLFIISTGLGLGGSTASILDQIINMVAMTGSIYIARRWLDKRSFESLGLKLNRQTSIDILAGVGITFLQMSFIFLVMSGFGWLTFTGFAWEIDPVGTIISNVLIFFIAFIFVAWNEELQARGYHLQTIASGLNLFWGVIISSAVFGLQHLANPNATWVSTAALLLAGIFFAYAYIRTKQLWLPMGLHLGWNFFEGVVFGFPVSGLDIYALTRIELTGPVLWTGGAFGPEAGLIVLPALILGALIIHLYTTKRTSYGVPQNDVKLKD
jgi:hypothetical protein